MNQPGIGTGYWEWRFSWQQLASWHDGLTADLTRLHGRIPEGRTGPHRYIHFEEDFRARFAGALKHSACSTISPLV